MESITVLLLGLFLIALCGGTTLLAIATVVVGVVLLRRQGNPVTVRGAVTTGAESVSRAFARRRGGLVDEDGQPLAPIEPEAPAPAEPPSLPKSPAVTYDPDREEEAPLASDSTMSAETEADPKPLWTDDSPTAVPETDAAPEPTSAPVRYDETRIVTSGELVDEDELETPEPESEPELEDIEMGVTEAKPVAPIGDPLDAPVRAPVPRPSTPEAPPEPPAYTENETEFAPRRRRLLRVGFFAELEHGDPDGGSLLGAQNDEAQPDEARIAAYLREAPVLVEEADNVSDVLDPAGEWIGPASVHTDGVWAWPADLAYYVEHYHVALPTPFVEHLADRAFTIGPVDLDRVEL